MNTLIALITCLYTTDCPRGNECVVDSGGHGYCMDTISAKRDVTTIMDGARGSFCTFTADCDEGLVCVKQRINDYGVCSKETK